MHVWAEKILAIYDFDYLFPDAPVFTLTSAERQLLEVTKAMLSEPEVLLLDEPTTALGPEQVDLFHRTILNQAKKGVGVVYVSHRLAEVLTVADRLTVLRDGRSQGTYEAAGTTESDLISLMIGRPFDSAFPPGHVRTGEESDVLVATALQGPMFGPLDFKVSSGEILGIAGAEGNGQEGLFLSLSGRVPPKSGSVRCAGKEWDLITPDEALRAGILLLPGDRKNEALFPVLGVRSNATVQVLKKFSLGGWINSRKERRAVAQTVDELKVRTPSLEQPVRFLSGGNQQKVALTRTYLRGVVNVILAFEPTQGVDAGARFDIYEALRAKAAQGTAIIVKSSDPIELAGLCDRVIVMSRGQITQEIPKAELSEKSIIEAIVGGIGLRYETVAPAPSLSVEEQAQGKSKR
jgi:ribose transport system ATP-binding protein